MNKKLLTIAVVLGLAAVLALPVVANAQPNFGLNSVASYIQLSTTDIRVTIANIINAAMGLLGIVAVVIILIGGFKWMTAMGNEEAVKKAKNLIMQGVIGLLIIICAYAIATFIFSVLTSATNG